MRTHLTHTVCFAFLFGTLAELACAEPLYVDDKLVLNVYAEADQNSARVATIETGDAVEALEHAAKFIRVQLVDGREGWVSGGYLKAQPPAIVRLRELDGSSSSSETATKQLRDETARVKKQNMLYSLGLPFSLLLMIFIGWKAALRTLWRGGIEWRGTFYSLKSLRSNRI